MPRLITQVEKEVKLNKRIQNIQDLYDLAFNADCGNLINIEKFKLNLKMQQNQASLINASQMVANQAKLIDSILELYPSEKELKDLRARLRNVHAQIVKLIKEEFTTIRMKKDLERAKIL